jgi:cell division protein FtsW
MIRTSELRNHEPDYTLLVLFGILLVFGLVMLSSASAPVGYAKFGDSYFFIKRQLMYGLLPGLFLFLFFSKFDYHRLTRYAYASFLASIAILVVLFIPGIGSTLGTGARSWIALGSFTLQPAEIVKFLLIIFLSGYLAKKSDTLRSFDQGFLPSLSLGMIPIMLVVIQPDMGTATILFAILFGMFFVAGARFTHLLGLLSIGLVGFVLLVAIAPYRVARLTTFLHPELDPQGIGYQINQAFLAIGSGGIFGAGLGHSQQKFQYLPEVNADSIFAVISEEMGFIVTSGVIILLVFIAMRTLRLAKDAPDTEGRLILTGCMMWFMVQSFFNIGAMVGLLPLTGVPLPFVSHGGTALMMALGALGVMSNVSKQVV